MFKRQAKQFCLDTALHGYRFIVLPRRILLERTIWIVICIVSCMAALTLVTICWTEFRHNPVVTVTDSNHYPIWHYPFPGITICDYNKISKKGAQQLATLLSNQPNNKTLLNQIKLLKYINFYNKYKEVDLLDLLHLQGLLYENNISIEQALLMISSKCDDILVKCMWKGEEKDCKSIFETVKTSFGFCCSFNYYAPKNHTFGGIMAYKVPDNPRRVSACGYQTGLQVLVNTRSEDYFATLIPSYGCKVLIHNSYDFPDWNAKSSLIPMKTVSFIGLDPTITYCSADTKEISAKERKCWFPEEKKLIYFEKYTFQNCMVECRVNLTLELCQCVPFFDIPSKNVHGKLDRICNLQDIPCLSRITKITMSSVPYINSNSEHFKEVGQHGICQCLDDCQTTDYVIQSSAGKIHREFSMNHPSLYSNIKLENHSVFRVFFNDIVGFKNRRNIRFNWHTLLALYGGLLGFFMGFSFISGIEIIYFLTVRPYTNNKREKSNFEPIKIESFNLHRKRI